MGKFYSHDEYRDYIQNSPIWASKRTATFLRDNYSCTECGYNKREMAMHCHHISWRSYCYPLGSEPIEGLTTLCEVCHTKKHPVKTNYEPSELDHWFKELHEAVEQKKRGK